MNRVKISMAVVILFASIAFGETWRLDDGKDWKDVSSSEQEQYIASVSKIKQQVNKGETKAVIKSLEKLKKDHPDIAGADLERFIEAEVFYSKGKFVKAIRTLDKLFVEHPKSPLFEAAVDRQFAIATAFLAGKKKPVLKIFKIRGYAEGEKIMDKISERTGDAPIAARATVAVAQSFEERHKYEEAYSKWSEISSKWPTGDLGKEALLAMARCKHAGYRGPRYDSGNLTSAKSYYESFKKRYPQESAEIGIDRRLSQIREQLAFKQYSIGEHYRKAGNIQSANFYYEMVVSDWPDSIASKMALKARDAEPPQKEKEETWKRKAVKKFEKLFL